MDKYKEYYLHDLTLFYERGKMYKFEEVIQSINTNLTSLNKYKKAKNKTSHINKLNKIHEIYDKTYFTL